MIQKTNNKSTAIMANKYQIPLTFEILLQFFRNKPH